MKIPEDEQIGYSSAEAHALIKTWSAAAGEMELEYGVWIKVDREVSGFLLSRIFFKVMEHEFDSLHDLRKALENKAFM